MGQLIWGKGQSRTEKPCPLAPAHPLTTSCPTLRPGLPEALLPAPPPNTRTHTGTQSMTAFTLWDALDFLCFVLRSSLPSPFYGVSRADLSQGARCQFVRFQNCNSPESDKFRGYIFNLRILFCSSYLPGHFWQYLVPSSYTQYLLSF